MANAYFETLNPQETNPILVSLRAFAIENNVPIITEEGLRFLHQIIQLRHATRVLEIGTAIAYSTISMAIKHENLEIITIERDPNMIELAKQHIQRSGAQDRITLIEEDALQLDETTLPKVDLIFIDAAKSQSDHFFNKYKKCLTEEGIIITDNLLFHGLVGKHHESNNLRQLVTKIDRFNRFVVKQKDFDTTIYSIGDGMSVSIKKEVIK
jgi:predicted O-methyltransferase YrrM